MADLYIPFNDLLRKNNTNLRQRPRKRSSIHDEFLKEAYRIVPFPFPCMEAIPSQSAMLIVDS